ncbi:hypothetical protein ACFSYD_17705 [Paracoccus aerius]
MMRQATAPVLIALIGLSCALILGAPGRTITSAFANDVLIFLDGAHRISRGQVPNRDFHTALGPLVYLIPAAGYWITGSLGGALPVGMALVILFFTLLAAHVLGSRLHPLLAVPVGAFLILLLAVPINLGDRIGALSFAMFYNRIGWAALGLLVIMYLPPLVPRPWQEARDVLCAAALTLLQLYSKLTYGAVALAFLVFLAVIPGQRRRAALALAVVMAAAAVAELFWRGTASHLADLVETARISGGRGTGALINVTLRNFADLAVFALIAGLALWQERSLRDAVFYAGCVAAGLLIVSQNAHNWGSSRFMPDRRWRRSGLWAAREPWQPQRPCCFWHSPCRRRCITPRPWCCTAPWPRPMPGRRWGCPGFAMSDIPGCGPQATTAFRAFTSAASLRAGRPCSALAPLSAGSPRWTS